VVLPFPLFFCCKKGLPNEAERGISMSKMKTRNHQFFYEGMYWSSRQQYAAWVAAQRTRTIPTASMEKASIS